MTTNIALIGTKFMGRAHSNAWLNQPRFFPAAGTAAMHTVLGRNVAELEAFAAQWGWDHTATDLADVLASGAIDLVDVATPNNAHADLSIAALEAGVPVACEKPLAATLDDARRMAAAADAAGVPTFVWYNYRRVPAVALAHRMVRDGALGRIYHARASYLQGWAGPDAPLVWRFRGDVAGSGAHGDLGAHIIDAVRFVTGEEITRVDGAIEETFIEERPLDTGDGAAISGSGGAGAGTGTSTVDDAVAFLSRLSGGAVATFEASRLATGYHNANRFELHGERGALRFDFERMNELGYYDASAGAAAGWTTIDVTRGGDGHPYAGAYWPDSHGLGYEHSFLNQAADIVTVLNGGEPEVPLPDFADAFETQKVLHAAIVSAREHRPVELDEL